MWWRIPLIYLASGLAVLYVGERTLTGNPRWIVDGVGALLIAVAFTLAVLRAVQARDSHRRAAWRILVEYGLVFVGLAVYVAHLYAKATGPGSELRMLLRVVWPTLVLLGLLPAIAKEVTLARMARSPTLEGWRLRLAGRSARILVLGVITFGGVNYAASRWNRTIDLSYFKTAQPGSSTEALVRNLTRPIEVLLFFPPGNEVLEHVRSYAEHLAQASSMVTVKVLDQALAPQQARALQVRNNGYLAIKGESTHETVRIGLEVEDAQRVLRTLDAKVQRSLIKVARPPRLAYLTSGHEEREDNTTPGDTRLPHGDFRKLLESQGFGIRRLGLGEGLGRAVPGDATVVIIAGPVAPLLPEEQKTLVDYFQAGGSLLVLTDPDHGDTLDGLCAELGVRVQRGLISSREQLFRLEGQRESRYNIVAGSGEEHPANVTVARSRGRLAVAFVGAGAVDKVTDTPATLKVTPTLRAISATGSLAMAIEATPGGRAMVFGDADFAANGLVAVAGNTYALLDGLRWLAHDEESAGEVTSEEDIPVLHRTDRDRIWFYGTTFLVPTAVLGAGLFGTRRRRNVRRAS